MSAGQTPGKGSNPEAAPILLPAPMGDRAPTRRPGKPGVPPAAAPSSPAPLTPGRLGPRPGASLPGAACPSPPPSACVWEPAAGGARDRRRRRPGGRGRGGHRKSPPASGARRRRQRRGEWEGGAWEGDAWEGGGAAAEAPPNWPNPGPPRPLPWGGYGPRSLEGGGHRDRSLPWPLARTLARLTIFRSGYGASHGVVSSGVHQLPGIA